jgi:hypothetical protein
MEFALAKLFHFAFTGTILLGVVVWGFAAYYQIVFHYRWHKYMRTIGTPLLTACINSPYAIFSSNLPEELRALRRKLLISWGAFLGVLGMSAVICFWAWKFGYFPE